MDKCRSSRKQQQWPFRGHSLLVLLLISWTIALWPHLSNAITLSHADAQRIGKKIWQNECNGTISGLTAWNQGEDFASLGIGHFIWYPKGRRGPFEESFPKVVSFISKRGAKLPTLLLRGVEQSCPWNSRAEFSRAQHTVEMNQLRQFLVDTIDLQAEKGKASCIRSVIKVRGGACCRSSKACTALPTLLRLMNSRVRRKRY